MRDAAQRTLGAPPGARHHDFMLKSVTPRNRRVLLSGATGVLQRLAQLAASVIILPLVLHRLGEAGFGVWGAATSLTWAAAMLDLGLGGALVTLLPAARHKGEDPRDYVTACLLVGAALGLALLAGGAAVLLAWPCLMPSAPFLAAGLCMAVNIPLGLAGSLWFGLQKGHVAGLWDLVQTGLMLGFVIAGAWAGVGVTVLTLAVFGAGVLANAGSLGHALATQPMLRPKKRPNFTAIGHALRGGALLALITIAASCAYVFDNVLALDWLGPQAAAQMTVALRVCITAIGMLMVATQALWRLCRGRGAGRPPLGGANIVARHARGGRAGLRRGWGDRDRGQPGAGALAGPGFHLLPALFFAMAGWIITLSLPRAAESLLNAVAQYRGQSIAELRRRRWRWGSELPWRVFRRRRPAGATPSPRCLFLPRPCLAVWREVAAPRFMKAQRCRS